MKQNRNEKPAKNVDEYLAAVTEEARDVLQQLRMTIRATVPEAEETISYRIPTYKHPGPLVHFTAFPDHRSFVVISRPALERSGATSRATAPPGRPSSSLSTPRSPQPSSRRSAGRGWRRTR